MCAIASGVSIDGSSSATFGITLHTFPTFPIMNNLYYHNGNPPVSDFWCDATNVQLSSSSGSVQCVFESVTDINVKSYEECSGHGDCNTETGVCACHEGYYGDHCGNNKDDEDILVAPALGPFFKGNVLHLSATRGFPLISTLCARTGGLEILKGGLRLERGGIQVLSDGIKVMSGGLDVQSGNLAVRSGALSLKNGQTTLTAPAGPVLLLQRDNSDGASPSSPLIEARGSRSSDSKVFEVLDSGSTVVHGGGLHVLAGGVTIASGGQTITSGGLRVESGERVFDRLVRQPRDAGDITTTHGGRIIANGALVSQGQAVFSNIQLRASDNLVIPSTNSYVQITSDGVAFPNTARIDTEHAYAGQLLVIQNDDEQPLGGELNVAASAAAIFVFDGSVWRPLTAAAFDTSSLTGVKTFEAANDLNLGEITLSVQSVQVAGQRAGFVAVYGKSGVLEQHDSLRFEAATGTFSADKIEARACVAPLT
ncbi:EGF-like domain, extracellular [Phytophthora cactorum]|nr:EGF-like domain, extracellular [Phytophthora cactorum]